MVSSNSHRRGPDHTSGAAVERFVSALMRWATRPDVRRSMHSPRVELSATDEWLLRRIREVGPVRLSELAAWQSVDKSTMTTQIHHLERHELISRAADPHDRRVVLLRATAKGRRLQDANIARARDVLDSLTDDWSDADRAELARLMTRLTDRLEAPADPPIASPDR